MHPVLRLVSQLTDYWFNLWISKHFKQNHSRPQRVNGSRAQNVPCCFLFPMTPIPARFLSLLLFCYWRSVNVHGAFDSADREEEPLLLLLHGEQGSGSPSSSLPNWHQLVKGCLSSLDPLQLRPLRHRGRSISALLPCGILTIGLPCFIVRIVRRRLRLSCRDSICLTLGGGMLLLWIFGLEFNIKGN